MEPNTSLNDRPTKASFLVFGFSSMLFAAFAALRGTDVNWDFLNYHHYVAYLLLNHRLDLDYIPAQIQTYSAPLVYLPHYWLVTHVPPIAAGITLGAIHGLNGGLIFLLAKAVQPPGETRLKTCAALLCALVGVTAPLYLSEVGTSFADITTSLLIIGSLLLVLHASRRALPTPLLLASGLLGGVAVGLKLTNAVFLIGLGMALAVASAPIRPKLRALTAFAGSAALGGVLAMGHWPWVLWQKFGNPIFPFYNGLFKSPFYPLRNFRDTRFLPQSPLDGMSYPFQWAVGLHPTCELSFRDVRFALLTVLFLGIALALGVARWRGKVNADQAAAEKAPARLLLVFFVSSFLVWMAMFSIQRYIVTLELMSGVAMLAGLMWLLKHPRHRLFALSVAAAIAVVTTKAPDWGHVPWSRHWVEVAAPAVALPPDALYVMTSGHPFAYVIPYMPAGSRFVRIDGNFVIRADSPLGAEIQAVLSRHRGDVFVMQPADARKPPSELLAGYGLTVAGLFTTIDTPASRVQVFRAIARSR